MGRSELLEDALDHALGVVGRDHAVRDEPLRVGLAHGNLQLDPLGLEGLRVRSLVLLVVPETAVADEIDDDVVAELLAIRERQANGRDGGFWIIRIDMDDRDVEAFCEVARVARRPALCGIGREPDLVVRDEVQRPACRVAVEAVEVERLGDNALPGERRVPVDEDGERDRRVVSSGARRSIRLLRSREPFDDWIDGFEVARVRGDRDLDLPGSGDTRLGRREVVLDVAGAPFRIGDERVDRALSFELAKERRVRAADDMSEDVETPTMGDPDEDLVRSASRGELDGLVEHRHEDVEPFDGELLLPDERATEVRLERLDPCEPIEELAPLIGGELGLRNRPDSMACLSHTRSAWSEMCSIS